MSAPVTTKNWLPEVPGGSAAVFAIATTPFVYFASDGGVSTTRVAGAAGAVAVRVAALDHEAGDDPVEGQAVEEALLDERGERGGRVRRVLHVERERERALARLHRRPCRSSPGRAPASRSRRRRGVGVDVPRFLRRRRRSRRRADRPPRVRGSGARCASGSTSSTTVPNSRGWAAQPGFRTVEGTLREALGEALRRLREPRGRRAHRRRRARARAGRVAWTWRAGRPSRTRPRR